MKKGNSFDTRFWKSANAFYCLAATDKRTWQNMP